MAASLTQSLPLQQTRDTGLWLVAVSALLFACKGTLVKFLYALGATVDDVLLLRMLFALPVYGWFAVSGLRREHHALHGSQLAGVAVIGVVGYYLASYLDLLGLQTVSAGLERVILYTYPVFVLLFSAFLWRRAVAPAMLACMAVIYSGLLMVFYADIRLQPSVSVFETGVGALWVLGSAIAFACYVIGSEHYLRHFSSRLFTALAMLAACVAVAVHYVAAHPLERLLHLAPAVYGWCALMALVFTVLPSFMMSAGVRLIGSTRAAAVGMIGPVATVLVAGLFLGESVTVLQFAGLTVVMLGVHRLQRS